MSRSGYTDDCDGWPLICYRGAVASAVRGKRGQKMLRDLLAALDAMQVKELIVDELQVGGSFCALGALGNHRGLPMAQLDPYDFKQVAASFDIAPSLAREVVFCNDEGSLSDETPEQRWSRMRQWVVDSLRNEDAA